MEKGGGDSEIRGECTTRGNPKVTRLGFKMVISSQLVVVVNSVLIAKA